MCVCVCVCVCVLGGVSGGGGSVSCESKSPFSVSRTWNLCNNSCSVSATRTCVDAIDDGS